jgi:hypothetical protein
MLQIACKYSDEIVDRDVAVLNPIVEKLLRVQGRIPTGGPPVISRDDIKSVHTVPPRPFVTRTLPVDMKSPEFESRANTLRSTIVSDIRFSSSTNYL